MNQIKLICLLAMFLFTGCSTVSRIMNITEMERTPESENLQQQFEDKKNECRAIIKKMDKRISGRTEKQMFFTIGGAAFAGTSTVLLAISSANVAGAAITGGIATVLATALLFYQDGGLKDPVSYAIMRDRLDKDIKAEIEKWPVPLAKEDDETTMKQKQIISKLDSICFAEPYIIPTPIPTPKK